MKQFDDRALLLIISAPSGAGKSTLCRRLLAEFDSMNYSISCTTRVPRPGEVAGRDYFFVGASEFHRRAANGELLEQAEVHGHFYGTPRAPVEDALHAGRDVAMDIDVRGAHSIRRLLAAEPESILARAYVDVFIMPPDIDTLRRRLEKRAQDAPDVIARRLCNAQDEMRRAADYRYLIVNDDLDRAYDNLRAIVLAERRRQSFQYL